MSEAATVRPALTTVREQLRQHLDGMATSLIDLSHEIHAHPELAFAEVEAAARVAGMLAADGFEVRTGIAELPTALAARAGAGELVIGLLAEYDALPDVGHACGHNIIAAASVGAARLLAPVADELGITVRVFGSPAEESGGGKILMLERGVFDGVHAAMMVHPAPVEVARARCLAVAHLQVDYTGRTSHAGLAPQLGRNAADAITVAQVAIGLLRQHIDPHCRVHGIVTDGGEAANIVPGHTQAQYLLRAESMAELEQLRARVEACLHAGALATGCTVEISLEAPTYSDFRSDTDIDQLYRRNAEALGRTFSDGAELAGSSTDMANVSQALPAIHPAIGLACGAAVNHQPEFAGFCAEPTGDRAVLDGALAMAWTIVDLATDPALRARLLAGRFSD